MLRLEKQKGLSLIELMVGLVLASLLLLGVLQIFDGNRRTHTLQESLSRIQESGRIAADMLSKELRNAAFTGCVVDDTQLVDNLGTIGDYVAGTDNATGATPAIGTMAVEVGTDVLTVRGAADACSGDGRVVSNAAGNAVVLSESCGLSAGDEVLVANCQAGNYTSIASVSGSAPAVTVTTVDTFGAPYGPEAKIYTPYLRTFFVARNVNNLPGLYVSDGGGAAQEIIPGVEDFQVLFGRDTGADNIVDIWGGPPADSDESDQVAAVRIQLLVAADERSGARQFEYTPLGGALMQAPDDGRLRKVYTVLSKVRNRGSR